MATLKYQIFSTRLANQERFLGRIPTMHNYDQAGLIDHMIDLGTSVSRGEIQSILSLLELAIQKICGEGSTACLDGFVRFAPAISGAFDSEGDGFVDGRNTVYVNATVSTVFNDRFALLTSVEKVDGTFKTPRVFSIRDLATETTNQKVTVNNIVTLGGTRLKFDPQNSGEFLRFVNADDPTQFVPVTKFQKFTDKEVVFLMPSVTFANGYFELANAMNTNRIRSDKSVAVEVAA